VIVWVGFISVAHAIAFLEEIPCSVVETYEHRNIKDVPATPHFAAVCVTGLSLCFCN
jgi:hypothetical protein